MELTTITNWLDENLKLSDFNDVSNNGLQIARRNANVEKVAFAVDASAKSVREAAASGAGLLVVHHGLSWGGGVRYLTGGVYEVIKTAMDADLALYGCHLPLDASERFGNNWELARLFGLEDVRKAFCWHGNTIGVVGQNRNPQTLTVREQTVYLPEGLIGVCSGGAGEFAEEAKNLGCALYVTGEASWGEVIAAENCGMNMLCLGHYETETFGVSALARALSDTLHITTINLTEK